MTFTPMAINGAWVHTPNVWPDERGSFHELFRRSTFASQLNRDFEVKQVNQSLSRKGVVRGIHVTVGGSKQAKYISCPVGAIWDVVVDLRESSKTFGRWDAIELNSENKKTLYIEEGLGHAFLSLTEESIAVYLCNSEYDSASDRAFNPLSKSLNIPFLEMAKSHGIEKLIMSSKDSSAPELYLG